MVMNAITLKDERYARDGLLGGRYLDLDENSIHWISNHIDCFVSQSRGNKIVEVLVLYPNAFNRHDDDVWDNVGQAVGNLQALDRINICIPHNYHDNDNDDADDDEDQVDDDEEAEDDEDDDDDDDEDQVVPSPDWEILARILSHMRQKVEVDFDDSDMWAIEELQSLARAIRGHPTIASFDRGIRFPYEYMDSLYSALATLPALESITLSNPGRQARPEDESTMAHHESLTKLLRVPSLRSVGFDRFSFTPALCQATANAFIGGTAVTKLDFRGCSFSDGDVDGDSKGDSEGDSDGSSARTAEGDSACAVMIASCLSRNTSVSHIKVMAPLDLALDSALAAALPSNSTLRRLDLNLQNIDGGPDLPPVFLALAMNTGLKSLKVRCFGSMDESLCTAMQNGLGMNETLESLELNNVRLCDDTADLWFRALSFLHTNKALKFLKVDVERGVTESCLFAFRIDIAATLKDNTSLESLSIRSWYSFKIKAEEFFALVAALQHNTTLKSFNLKGCESLTLTHDEDRQMAALLKKNYVLERLPFINHQGGDLGAILRLNGAGRRYLVQDGSSIAKGVEVLSRVNNDINCVFLHLSDNPRLCDRRAVESAVEMVSASGLVDDVRKERGSQRTQTQAQFRFSRPKRDGQCVYSL